MAKHELVIGAVILEELERALRTKVGLASDRIAEVLMLSNRFDMVPKPAHPSAIPLRDTSDRWIIATALAGLATVLVTGDRDLIEVQDAAAPLSILTPREFWDLLRGAPEV